MKQYVSPRYPSYSIGKDIRFVNGIFSTDDTELQAIVESNDWYGIHILPLDEMPVIPVPRVEEPVEPAVKADKTELLEMNKILGKKKAKW